MQYNLDFAYFEYTINIEFTMKADILFSKISKFYVMKYVRVLGIYIELFKIYVVKFKIFQILAKKC